MHDYRRKIGVDAKFVLLPETAPVEFGDRQVLWNAVELKERRADSQLCREWIVSLPVELSADQNVQLMRSFLQDEFVSKGMIADCCFHKLSSGNPHCHILLTMRQVDKGGFGKKERS